MNASEPLVSVVTPVYNGEKYLTECIESVSNQTHTNFEHIIVNNASTDKSGEIAQSHARKDTRIKVYHNESLLPIMKNWNRALRQISPQSKYCKVVHADDWIFPDCLSKMIQLAEQNPTVGIVGAYGLQESKIRCGTGLGYPSTVLPGREVCRLTLIRRTYPFLRPTCLLIRADLIRNRDPFYTEDIVHADVEVCYELLRSCDFGFVHQVLTYIRWHDESVTLTYEKPWLKSLLWNLDLLVRYGKEYLNEQEYEQQLRKQLARYYQHLADAKRKGMETDFWNYHRQGLQNLGLPFSHSKLWIALFLRLLVLASNAVRDRVRWAP